MLQHRIISGRSALVLAIAAAAVVASCGFGLYDDDGSASPTAQWWPWCVDGGVVDGGTGSCPASGTGGTGGSGQ